MPIPTEWYKAEVAEVILSVPGRIQTMRPQEQRQRHLHIHKPQARLPGLNFHIQHGKYNGNNGGEDMNFAKGDLQLLSPPNCTANNLFYNLRDSLHNSRPPCRRSRRGGIEKHHAYLVHFKPFQARLSLEASQIYNRVGSRTGARRAGPFPIFYWRFSIYIGILVRYKKRARAHHPLYPQQRDSSIYSSIYPLCILHNRLLVTSLLSGR